MIKYYNKESANEYYNSAPLYKEKDLEAEARFYRSFYEQCPVCGVRNSMITNVHCTKEHNMTKKEVESKYGKIMNGRELFKKMEAEKAEVGN